MSKGPLIGAGRTAEVFAWGEDRALKLFFEGFPPDAIEGEAAKTRAVHAAGLPVPAVDAVIEVDGRRGIIFERVEGPSMLAAIHARPGSLLSTAARLADLHAQMHGLDAPDLPALRPRLEWAIRRAPPLPDDLRAAALRALDRLPDGESICHMDFHPDNVVLTARGPVILDWDNSARGDPLADVRRTLMLFQMGLFYARSAAERRIFALALPLASALYRRRYVRRRHADGTALRSWAVPILAARLAEGIAVEQAATLALLRAALSPEG